MYYTSILVVYVNNSILYTHAKAKSFTHKAKAAHSVSAAMVLTYKQQIVYISIEKKYLHQTLKVQQQACVLVIKVCKSFGG